MIDERLDELMWCPKCRNPEMFTFSGSHTKATCLTCETEVSGHERIKRLQDALAFDFMFTPMSNRVDEK